MSSHSPRPSHNFYSYDPSTPPPPPPKPSAQPGSNTSTLQAGSPLPPSPPGQPPHPSQYDQRPLPPPPPHEGYSVAAPDDSVVPPEDGWLPSILKDKSTADLQHILQTPSLQHALIHSPETAHPSLPASTQTLHALLAQNIALATQLQQLESHVQHQRSATQSRLLSLRALERQWRAKQAEQDEALREFSPPALYQRLVASVAEQESLCRGLEESFLEGGGPAGFGGDDGGRGIGERDVAEFVRRLREGRKIAYMRAERKERWDEGRVGGWR